MILCAPIYLLLLAGPPHVTARLRSWELLVPEQSTSLKCSFPHDRKCLQQPANVSHLSPKHQWAVHELSICKLQRQCVMFYFIYSSSNYWIYLLCTHRPQIHNAHLLFSRPALLARSIFTAYPKMPLRGGKLHFWMIAIPDIL